MAYTPVTLPDKLASKRVAAQQLPRPLPLLIEIFKSQLGSQPEKLAAAMDALDAYQHYRRRRVPKPQVVHDGPDVRAGSALARRIGSEDAQGEAVLLVPSLVNGNAILDLDEDRSFARWLAGRGHETWLVDWGTTVSTHRDLSIDRVVTDRLVPLIEQIGKPVHLVGYCLGGTIALAAACLTEVASLTAIAAPWQFSHYPASKTRSLSGLWATHQERCSQLGLVPMEILQTGLWSLHPKAIAEKYAAVGTDEAKLSAFVTAEDWANSGEPLPLAAARQLIEDFYRDDAPGKGHWSISDTSIAVGNARCPTLSIRSTSDSLVPLDMALKSAENIDCDRGHVGMMVGSQRKTALWEPVSDWIHAHKAA